MPTDPNELDAAIRAAEPSRPDSMDALVAALAEAEVVIPVQAGPEGDATVVTLMHGDIPYVPAYTTAAAARSQVPDEMSLQVTSVRELVANWQPGVSLALNPGTEPTGWLAPEGVLGLFGVAERTVPPGTDVQIGDPDSEPVELLERASAWLAADGRAVAGYRALVSIDGHTPGIVLGVVAADPRVDPRPMLIDLSEALADLEVDPFDLILVDRDQPDVIAAWMLGSSTPFFTAERPPRRRRGWARR